MTGLVRIGRLMVRVAWFKHWPLALFVGRRADPCDRLRVGVGRGHVVVSWVPSSAYVVQFRRVPR